jgi:hypothetical protein
MAHLFIQRGSNASFVANVKKSEAFVTDVSMRRRKGRL